MTTKYTVTNGAPTIITPDPNVAPENNPGPAIDTGVGGFVVDGVQLEFDLGLSEPSSQTQPYGPPARKVDVSAGYVDSSGKPKDLTNVVKTKLGQYLSNLTSGKEGEPANAFPINYQTSAVSITDPDGTPGLQSPANLDPKNNDVAFAPDSTAGGSSTSDAFPKITLNKGKAARSAPDGNSLLAGIPGNATLTAQPGQLTGQAPPPKPPSLIGPRDQTAAIAPYQSAVLANNRFVDASSAFDTGDVANPDPGFNPQLTVQKVLGQYVKPTSTGGQTTYSTLRLAAVGPLLTMRAGLELGASSAGADPNDGGLQAAALLPGFGQLGVQRIDQTLLQAKDILAGLTTDEVGGNDILSIGGQSWGQLNNTDDPYSGTDALGMVLLSTTLVVGIELIFDALSILFGLITPSLKLPPRDSSGRYSLGEYFPGSKAATQKASGGIGGLLSSLASLNLGALLGIQPTNYPFQKALTTGLNAFFQIPGGGGIGLNQLVGALTSSTDSPGFNSIVARSIIRSSLTIIDSMKKIGGNPMHVISAILAMIDTIRTSKLIAAINVFCTLGDAQLSLNPKFADQTGNGGIKISQMDSIPDEAASGVNKSRLNNSLKLAWASNRSPVNYLLPAPIMGLGMVTQLGQFDPYHFNDINTRAQTTLVKSDAGGRIDPKTAAAFEKVLDAEYVPFYFHDIRTNEMVAFHAFLASLTDDYTSNYDKTDGFGRVEPVRIYKSTERKINLSFYVAATSVNDFDEMWLKINKLVTLVYPQFTQGVQLQDKGSSPSYVFTQPFSQLLGASPLIRIRLGDLLKSNYSQFALARLFGAGNDAFQVAGQQFTSQNAFEQDNKDAIDKAFADAKLHPNGETYYADDMWYDLSPAPAGGLGGIPAPSIPGTSDSSGPQFVSQFNPGIATAGGVAGGTLLMIKVSDIADDGRLIGEVAFNDDPDSQDVLKPLIDGAQKRLADPDDPLGKTIGGKYLFPPSSLTPTPTTATKIVQKAYQAQEAPFAQALSDFTNPAAAKPNAIAKAFSDSGGKGLAGFIETMNFDWYDKVTWETKLGRTAPKMCKVTIHFSPIHDITPGLDHFGMNRAPVYPVGLMNQGPIPPPK